MVQSEVPEALSAQGIGSRLVRGTLDALPGESVSVVPRCGFVAAYIERHPEHRGLLAYAERATSSCQESAKNDDD